MAEPFALTDCALISVATGEKAHNLRELRDRLYWLTDTRIMYYHFWDVLLRPHFVDPEYQNDFAAWAFRELHDQRLAERLSILNPTDYKRMDDLRQQVIETIEDHMDEDDFILQADVRHPFFFMRSQMVVFDTQVRISTPEQLSGAIVAMSLNSIFYHFIDARRRTPSGENDFSAYLRGCGPAHERLADEISAIDPYFNSLAELRDQLISVFERHIERNSRHG